MVPIHNYYSAYSRMKNYLIGGSLTHCCSACYNVFWLTYQVPGRKSSATWNKSIEICSLKDGKVEQISEHPLNLDESKANVSYIQEKLSQEAFDGARVKLLNTKNILLADAEGTRGKVSNKLIHMQQSTVMLQGQHNLFLKYSIIIAHVLHRLAVLEDNKDYQSTH